MIFGAGYRPGFLPQTKSLECAGFARNFAEVEDQVRFLARTLITTADKQACECDGLARLTSNQLDGVRLPGGLLMITCLSLREGELIECHSGWASSGSSFSPVR